MWMNVLEALTGVTSMQLATTLKEVTPVLATVDTQAMGFIVQVSMTIVSTPTKLEVGILFSWLSYMCNDQSYCWQSKPHNWYMLIFQTMNSDKRKLTCSRLTSSSGYNTTVNMY